MLKNTILILTLCLTTNVVAQQNSLIIQNLEFGLGYIFKTNNENSLVRYQIASRNLLLNERLGFMYTIEYPLDEGTNPKSSTNEMNDLFGLNYRFSNDFSFQAASGLAGNSVFKSKNGLNGVRKAISITYHPDNTPFTITTGYSGSMGFSLGVNYRIFFNKKKDKEKIKNKESQLTKKSASNKPANTSSTKKSSTRALMYPPSTIIAAKNANKDSNKSTTKEPIQEKAADSDKKQAEEKEQQAKQAAEKAAADAKKKAQKAVADAKKKAQKAADAKKLCDESEVLYPLNMYDLSSSEKKNLQKLAQYLKTNPKIKLQIFGSTDKSGSEEYNLKLGAKRTNSSENYLIQLGVSSKQLETINLGESKSQNSNSEQERAKSRSTTYKIIPLLP